MTFFWQIRQLYLRVIKQRAVTTNRRVHAQTVIVCPTKTSLIWDLQALQKQQSNNIAYRA